MLGRLIGQPRRPKTINLKMLGVPRNFNLGPVTLVWPGVPLLRSEVPADQNRDLFVNDTVKAFAKGGPESDRRDLGSWAWQVVMITGDQQATAAAIGKQIGILQPEEWFSRERRPWSPSD